MNFMKFYEDNLVWGEIKPTVFPKCVTYFSEFSDKKIVITVKRLKPASEPLLVWETNMLPHSTSKTHVRDGIFKLSPIHVSVIYQFPWIPFRKNPNEPPKWLFTAWLLVIGYWIPLHLGCILSGAWSGPTAVIYKSFDTLDNLTLMEGNAEGNYSALVPGKVTSRFSLVLSTSS